MNLERLVCVCIYFEHLSWQAVVDTFPSLCSVFLSKIEFVVAWSEKTATLQEFENFLSKIFGFLHMRINLQAVCNRFLTFICSAPYFSANAIVRIVKEKEKILLEMNVLSVAVGCNVVYKVWPGADCK